MTRHGDSCCACGATGQVVWAEEIGHDLCKLCTEMLSQAVWLSVKRGVEPQGGYTGVETAFLRLVSRVNWRCGVKGD